MLPDWNGSATWEKVGALSGLGRGRPEDGSESENKLTPVVFSSKTIMTTTTIEPSTEPWLASEDANFSTGCAGPQRGPAREKSAAGD
jgi:hypothetical protein